MSVNYHPQVKPLSFGYIPRFQKPQGGSWNALSSGQDFMPNVAITVGFSSQPHSEALRTIFFIKHPLFTILPPIYSSDEETRQLDGVGLNELPADFASRRLLCLPASLSTLHLPFSFFFSSSFWWCIPVGVRWPSSADALNKMTGVICFCHRVSPPTRRLKNTVLEGRECVCRV